MCISADRLSGVFFLLFGAAMYWLVIPAYVEQIEGGNIHPDTIPNAVSIVVAVCGAWLILKPTTHQPQPHKQFAVAAVYIILLGTAIYAMSVFGFIYVAPVLALFIMLLIGERRLQWLVPGVVGVPFVIWFLVSYVLDRALP